MKGILSGNRRCQVVQLSHGSVSTDARVLRSVSAAVGALGWESTTAVGVRTGSASADRPHDSRLRLLDMLLWSGKLRRISPRIASYVGLVEMSMRMVLRVALEHPRIIHCHDPLVLPAGWLASLLIGSRLVYDAHELESQQGGSDGVSWLCLAIERWCWPRISLLVSVSPSILNWYAEHLGPKPSVLVLNAPVLPMVVGGEAAHRRRSFGEQGYFHKRFGIPAWTPVFIYLGLLVRGRGVEPVLDVFRRAGLRSHVVFMGSGDTVGVADHAARFPNIHLHPTVPHDQVVRLVREADCGLCLIEDRCLSLRYSLPNKLFEYAFAGVPVLASRLPEIARVVREHGLGICCDYDADSIEAAVRVIERDGLKAPEGDLTELSWDTQAKRLQEAYRTLLVNRNLVRCTVS